MINRFLLQMKVLMMKSIQELHDEYEEISKTLQIVPKSPEDLAEMKKYQEEVAAKESERMKKLILQIKDLNSSKIIIMILIMKILLFVTTHYKCQQKFLSCLKKLVKFWHKKEFR